MRLFFQTVHPDCTVSIANMNVCVKITRRVNRTKVNAGALEVTKVTIAKRNAIRILTGKTAWRLAGVLTATAIMFPGNAIATLDGSDHCKSSIIIALVGTPISVVVIAGVTISARRGLTGSNAKTNAVAKTGVLAIPSPENASANPAGPAASVPIVAHSDTGEKIVKTCVTAIMVLLAIISAENVDVCLDLLVIE